MTQCCRDCTPSTTVRFVTAAQRPVMPNSDLGPAPSTLRFQWACGLAVLAHLALGLWASPGWLFSKYPDAVRLLRARRMGAEESADYSPLYLLLNELLEPQSVRLLQAAAGALMVWAIGRVALRLSGPWASVLAAWLVALSAPLLAYEATIEPDLLIAVLEILALCALTERVGRRPWALGLAGASLGLALALRPSGLLLLGLVAGVILIEGKKALRQRFIQSAILVAAGLLCGLGPTLWLRSARGGEARATMSVGAVMHMGNRPEGTGFGANPPLLIKQLEAQQRSFENPDAAHGIYRRFARTAEQQGSLTQGATEDYWVNKVLAFARNEPTAYLSLQGRKLQAFLVAPFAHDLTQVRDLTAEASRFALVPTPLLGILGAAGLLWVVLRRRGAAFALISVILVSHVLLSLIFYVVARYQLPALALLALLSAVLLTEIIGHFGEARWGRAAALAGACVLALSFWGNAASKRSRLLERGRHGGAAARAFKEARTAGDAKAATAAFVAAQAAQPFLRHTADWRGVDVAAPTLARASGELAIERFGMETAADSLLAAQLTAEAGRCDLALPVLEDVARANFSWAIYDRSLDPDLTAVNCHLARGDRTGALASAERALLRRPGAIDPLAHVLAGAVAVGDHGRAQRARELIDALHDPLSGGYMVAQAHLRWSAFAPALEAAERVIEVLPEAAVVHHVRALALAGLGRQREAVEAYDLAMRLFPTHPFQTEGLDSAVAVELAAAPFDPWILGVAAEHALRRGRWREAQEHLSHATSLYGLEPPPAHSARARSMSALVASP